MTRREERLKRRAEAKKKRQQRQKGRKVIFGLIVEHYEDGDDFEALEEKIEPVIRELAIGDGSWLTFLLNLLKEWGPVILKMLMGF